MLQSSQKGASPPQQKVVQTFRRGILKQIKKYVGRVSSGKLLTVKACTFRTFSKSLLSYMFFAILIVQMLLEDETLCLNEELYQFFCPNFENPKEHAP